MTEIDFVAMMPFAAMLGMRIPSASPDEVVGELDWNPSCTATAGGMHGGALMSLADTVGAVSRR